MRGMLVTMQHNIPKGDVDLSVLTSMFRDLGTKAPPSKMSNLVPPGQES